MADASVILPDGETLTATFGLDLNGGVYIDLSAPVKDGQAISGNVDLNLDGLTASLSLPFEGLSVTADVNLSFSGGLSADITVPVSSNLTLSAHVGPDSIGVSASVTTEPLAYDIPVSTVASGNWSYYKHWSSSYFYAEVANETVGILNGFIGAISSLGGVIGDIADGNALGLVKDSIGLVDAILSPTSSTAFGQGPSNTTQDVSGGAGGVTLTIPLQTNFDAIISTGDTITLDQANVDVRSLNISSGGALEIESAGNGLTVDTTLTNNGELDVLSGAALTLTNATNANLLKDNGGSILIAGAVTNEREIDITGGGSLTISGVLTNGGPDAIIEGDGGSVTVSGTLSGGVIEANGGALSVNGTTDSTVTLAAVNGGTLYIGGTVSGGTLRHDDTSAIQVNGATLSGVTCDGTLNLANGYVHIVNGLTTHGVNGSGPGTINAGSSGGTAAGLVFDNTQTIDNATITLGGQGAYYTVWGSSITDSDTANAGGQVLTFGSGLTIDTSGPANIGYGVHWTDVTADSIVNDGHIEVTANTLTIDPTSFTNNGVITVDAGASLNLTATSFIDSGRIVGNGALGLNGQTTLAGGSIVWGAGSASINGQLTGSGSIIGTVYAGGTIEALGGVLIVGGVVSGPGSLEIAAGATLELSGTVSNSVAFLAGGPATLCSTRRRPSGGRSPDWRWAMSSTSPERPSVA